MSLNKLIRPHPVQKILTAVPKCEDHIGLAVVDRPQHVVGNKPGHFVDESGALAEPLLERVGIFLLDVDTISDSYHCFSVSLSYDTRWGNDESVRAVNLLECADSSALVLVATCRDPLCLESVKSGGVKPPRAKAATSR